MGAAAVNAIVSPWFAKGRPAALAAAYNGASVGGVVFLPLWAGAIGCFGFGWASLAVGAVMVAVVWVLAECYFVRGPAEMGLAADGALAGTPGADAAAPREAPARSLRALGGDLRFLTLAGGMALGLFAQIGLLAHLFSLLVPALGTQAAGLAAGAATGAAIVGRTLLGWWMPERGDRRRFACASYGVQIAGSMAFLVAGGETVGLLLLGVVLFGLGIGNATSLPPMIAQVEFSRADGARAVPLMVAVAQGAYAFAPAVFGLIRQGAEEAGAAPGHAPGLFVCAAAVQMAAILLLLAGMRGRGGAAA
ncbi:MAG: MFS transporter [Hyphomicrobiaceae bacterium]|nr:MFS transporter [Hyphomicrobiaceae bacterium]